MNARKERLARDHWRSDRTAWSGFPHKGGQAPPTGPALRQVPRGQRSDHILGKRYVDRAAERAMLLFLASLAFKSVLCPQVSPVCLSVAPFKDPTTNLGSNAVRLLQSTRPRCCPQNDYSSMYPPHLTSIFLQINKSNSRSSSISVVRDVVGQEGGSIRGSLFEGAQTSTGNEASSFRHGGKRPRSTSSIFAAAATGMLTGRVVPTAEVAVPSFSTQQQAVHHDRQPNTLLRLRGQPRMRSGRVGVSNASGCVARAGKERVVLGDPVAAIAAASATATAVFRSNAAGAMILDESSNREDTLGEAAAMAADERRSSPPARLHEHSVGYHLEHDGKRKPKPSQSTVTDGNPEGRWSRGIPFSSGTHNDSHGCLTEGEAVASSSFLDVHHRRSSSPPAPAYEPSLLNEDNNTAEGLWRYNPDGHLKETARRSPEETQQQRYGSAGAQKIDGDVELAIGASSWANKTASPQHQEAESNARVEVEDDGETHAQTSQQRVSAVSTLEGGRPPSPTVDRQDFLSTIKKSDDAYHSVREDLLHYMKGVRARCAELRVFCVSKG